MEKTIFRKGFIFFWFAVIAIILFGQTVRFNYTFLDDQSLVLNNMTNLKTPSYISRAFSEDVFHAPQGSGYYYRPVLTLTFMADAILGGGNFGMFHFSNILFHILASFLLFLFFTELGYDRMRSFLFGLIFLVHPVITQAVAWVPGRNDTLLAIFIIWSFICWMKYLKTGSNKYLVLHLVLYTTALFTKENAIVLPILIVFYYTFVRRTPYSKFTAAGVSWFIITVIWAVIRFNAIGGANNVPFSEQVLSAFKSLPAILPFLGKAFFPFYLSVFPILADMKIPIICGIIAVGILVFLVWITKPKHWKLYLFAILWFLGFLLPSFVSVNNQIPNFSEHRIYLSLAGILMLVMETGPVRKTNFSRLIPVSMMVFIIVFFSVLTFIHSRNFKDNFTFWQNAVDTSPSHAFNYNNLGAMYFLDRKLDKAEILFRKALAINPIEPMANSNTGLVCMQTNRYAEAEKYYLEEIRINPNYDHVYYNLGLLYFNQSRIAEGIEEWEKTLTVNPRYLDAYKALLFSYQKLNRKADYDRIAEMARQNGVLPD